MTLWRATVVLAGSLMAAACGFQPLYAERESDPGIRAALAEVEVAPIPDRLGQVVRNDLQDRLTPYGAPASGAYRLVVSLNATKEGYGFRGDEAVTREAVRLEAPFQLVDQATGEVLLADTVSATASYDVVQSDFATLSAERDAERRTADEVGAVIAARVGLYFRTRESE